MNTFRVTWKWQPLVHVCRRWRLLIFASPRGLDLRLVCTRGTPVQRMLDIWPTIPIIIFDQAEPSSGLPISNVIAALERHDRIFGIWLDNLTRSEMQLFCAATNNRFPALTHVELGPNKETTRALPLGFLGGFTPCLRIVRLNGVPFSALPHVLSSAKDLVELQLRNIPTEGYISPMAMVAGLSALARLEKVSIEFRSEGDFDPMSQFPHPRRHIILPALTHFSFWGTTDYVEDFVSRIQAPSLYGVKITLFNQPLPNIPQLAQLIKRTEKLLSFNQAGIVFSSKDAKLSLLSSEREVYLVLRIICNGLEQQVSSLAQVCNQLASLVSRVELLDLEEKRCRQQYWQDCMDSRRWVELFQTFTTVNTLRMATEAGSLAWRVLRGLAVKKFMGMLPALYDLYVDEGRASLSVQEVLNRFLSERKRSGHIVTVAVHIWERQKECDSEDDNT